VLSSASIEYMPAGWTDAQTIVQKYAYPAMLGEITGAQAVAKMDEELRAAGLID